jgi:hypothetical protein
VKILLASLAILGLPFAALAQPAADDAKPTPLSGLTVTVPRASQLSGLTVTACQLPRNSRWPNSMFDAPTNAKTAKAQRTEPSPGTQQWLEDTVAMFEREPKFDAAKMPKTDIALTRVTEMQFQVIRRWVKCRGDLQSIKFLHVSQEGFDDYEVAFANGAIEWEVASLDAQQAARQSAIRYFDPQPVSGQFEDFLKSAGRTQPDYSKLSPDLAAAVQTQWPTLQKTFKDWGGLDSTYFLRDGSDGAHLYIVKFKHKTVVWKVAAVDGAGKLTGLQYAEAPD